MISLIIKKEKKVLKDFLCHDCFSVFEEGIPGNWTWTLLGKNTKSQRLLRKVLPDWLFPTKSRSNDQKMNERGARKKSIKNLSTCVRYLKKFLLTSIFYHTRLLVQTPIRNIQNDLKTILDVYLFWCSWVDMGRCKTGQKSMAMRKISTKPYQVSMLLAVPIRCLNPQPHMVKNQSQQIFILEIPNLGTTFCW